MSSWRVYAGTTNPAVIMRDAKRHVRQLSDAALYATDKAAAESQKRIRRDMASAKLGRLRTIVKFTSDRKKGRTPIPSVDLRWRAGAVVYRNSEKSPRAAGAWEAYTKGPVIVPKKGKWLAFPTANVPRRAGRVKMTPSGYRAAGLEGRTGPLVFIPGPNPGVAYLIAKDVTAPGNNKPGVATRTRGRGRVRREFVVMFILIRRTKRDRRFRPLDAVRAEQARIPQMMDQFLKNRARAGRATTAGPVLFRTSGSGAGFLGRGA